MLNIKNKSLKGTKFIDLFAGIGGFRLALESLGSQCVYSSEWDIYAQETYRANFHSTPDGDITLIDEKTIPDHEILCAGFPCQAFSISGKQKGFADSRGTLFFDVVRIVRAKKPKVIFLENVKNFANHDGGRTLSIVRQTILGLGYSFDEAILNPVDYGIPQKRERIYIVCFRNDLGVNNFQFPQKSESKKTLSDFLVSDSESTNYVIDREDLQIKKFDPMMFNFKQPIRIGQIGKGGQGERIYSPNGIAITLSAYGGGKFSKTGGYLINGKLRKLTPRECARIMGFPDWFKIHQSDSQAYKQFGNSVVVDVLQFIAMNIGKKLQNLN